MAATKLSDIIVPEVFNPNAIERTSEKTALLQSGIIVEDPTIDIGEGETITLPFYQDLSGSDNVWDDTTDITLSSISMARDTAPVLTREASWGSSSLAKALGQDDPMDAILELVANFWARKRQTTLIKILGGAMAASDMTGNVSDISSASGTASDADGSTFVDATLKLGDHSDEITDIAVHSATEGALRKKDLIDFIPDSDGNLTIRTFQGRRMHRDDSLPVSGSTYTSYLFAQGSVSLVDEMVDDANEPYRHPEKNGGTDALYTRRKFVLHPRGIRWTPGSGVPSSATPSNSELNTSSNWDRVWEPENIRIVQWKHTNA